MKKLAVLYLLILLILILRLVTAMSQPPYPQWRETPRRSVFTDPFFRLGADQKSAARREFEEMIRKRNEAIRKHQALHQAIVEANQLTIRLYKVIENPFVVDEEATLLAKELEKISKRIKRLTK